MRTPTFASRYRWPPQTDFTDVNLIKLERTGRSSAHPNEAAAQPSGTVARVTAAVQPPRRARGPTMHFRIVDDNQHRAVVDGTLFSCTRESITTEAVVTYRWSAFKDTTLLKGDCRTLNEAKILCRAALAGVLSSDVLAPGTAGASDAPRLVVPAGKPCERGG